MKRRLVFSGIFFLMAGLLSVAPINAANKETLQILQQVSMIQQQVRDLQDSQIKSNAIIQKLTEQILDQVTRLSAAVDDIKRSNSQTQAAVGTKVDSLTGNQQVLQESLDDLKARVNKLSNDLAAIKTTMQSIDSKIAAPAPVNPAPSDSASGPAGLTGGGVAPDSPDNLYQSALADYNGGRYKLALGEFQQYLKYYSDTLLATSAQFWIGQIYFMEGNYEDAVTSFNSVIERSTDSTKVSQAIYKKGLSLERLGQKAAATKEFRLLLTRYPNSQEAKLAAEELSKLSRTGSAASRRAPVRKRF